MTSWKLNIYSASSTVNGQHTSKILGNISPSGKSDIVIKLGMMPPALFFDFIIAIGCSIVMQSFMGISFLVFNKQGG